MLGMADRADLGTRVGILEGFRASAIAGVGETRAAPALLCCVDPGEDLVSSVAGIAATLRMLVTVRFNARLNRCNVRCEATAGLVI